MEGYPAKVGQLAILVDGLRGVDQATMQFLASILANERAVQGDGRQAENDALAASDPAAQSRETMRMSFYDTFYSRMGQLDTLITFLQAANGQPDPQQLGQQLANWISIP